MAATGTAARWKGAERAAVTVRYVFDGVYAIPPGFPVPAGEPAEIDARTEVPLSQTFSQTVSRPTSTAGSVGGWSLDVHRRAGARSRATC